MSVKNFVLGVGIVIVFGLLLWQGIEAFYPSPEYNDFCPEVRTAEFITTPERCEANGGKWEGNNVVIPEKLDGNNVTGWCDLDFYCRQDFNDAQDKHSQVVFFVSLIVGILVLMGGYLLLRVEPVGSALMASGIWSIFWGTAVNWRNFSSIWRFLLLLVAFVLLVWFALRVNIQDKKKNWWKFWR